MNPLAPMMGGVFWSVLLPAKRRLPHDAVGGLVHDHQADGHAGSVSGRVIGPDLAYLPFRARMLGLLDDMFRVVGMSFLKR